MFVVAVATTQFSTQWQEKVTLQLNDSERIKLLLVMKILNN